jgi:predicted DNA-binding ribbon-helix-helix protein
MTIYNTVYDTTLGSIIDTKKLIEKITESFIKDELFKENCGVDNSLKIKPVYITGYHDGESEIPLFTHSIKVPFKGTEYLCTDLRLFIDTKEYKINKDLGKAIKNKTEYNFIRSKSIIELAWVNDDLAYLKDNLKYAAHVFAVNISEAIARAYALDHGDRLKLNILGILYYRSLFLKKDELDYNNKETALIHTIKLLGINEKLFHETVDGINDLRNVNDFIAAIKSSLENVRLNNFNLVVLLTLIKNTWYGNNAKDYISVSLEHVPTWLAIVYTALNEKTYKNSMIYKICEKTKKAGNIESFIKSYVDFISKYNLNKATESLEDIELECLKY